jgi:hypothetical protein
MKTSVFQVLKSLSGFEVHYDDLWVSFVPLTDKARSLIRDYKGKGHDWYRFMATCVDYDGGITFPYNRVNKFTTYVNVRLRKDSESN